MQNCVEIKKILQQNKQQIVADYGVKTIGIFGSVVRGEQTETSDIDILVEFEKPVGFIKFIQLENRLAQLLGAKIDLATQKSLKPHIGKKIIQEVQYV